MEKVCKILGTGSSYEEKSYGSGAYVQATYEEAKADYDNFIKKDKITGGVISLKRLLNHHFLRNWSSKMIKKSLEAYFLPKKQNCTFLKTFWEKATFMPIRAG